jgi:hypothetical protein
MSGKTVLQKRTNAHLEKYLARKGDFDRRRRKLKLDFDTLYRLFADGVSSADIARRAGVSRPRVSVIYEQHFQDLFGISDLERRAKREHERRIKASSRLARAIEKDRVLRAIIKSAQKAGSERRIAPVLTTRPGRNAREGFRHRAVLVDGRPEPVHHLRAVHMAPRSRAYARTTMRRGTLERAKWAIFYIDAASHRRRILRCRSAKLLKALFSPGRERRDIYIPLDQAPNHPRYDFLIDEDNWG